MLRHQAERDPFALAELVGLVGLADEIDDGRVDDSPLDRHDDPVVPLVDVRRRSPGCEQRLVHPVESAALALHQLQVIEDLREQLVAFHRRVQDVARGDAQRQQAGVVHLQPVWETGLERCTPRIEIDEPMRWPAVPG